MIPTPPRSLEIIEEAIYQEQAAHDEYLKLARAAADPEERERYHDLAHQEMRHRQLLEERWRTLTGRRFRYKPAKRGHAPLPEPTSAATAALAFEVAMERKLDAIGNYRELAGSDADIEGRRFYQELADEEQRDYEWFRDRRNALEGRGGFTDPPRGRER